jgi:hypothetical protein
MKVHYRFILFFVLGWIMVSIISCTTAPIQKQVIRHGVIDYYELIEPLGTKHLYREEPIVDKIYYCLIHEVPEIIYKIDGTKRVRRWVVSKWR